MKKLLSFILILALMSLYVPWAAFADVSIAGDTTRRYNVLVMDISGEAVFLEDGAGSIGAFGLSLLEGLLGDLPDDLDPGDLGLGDLELDDLGDLGLGDLGLGDLGLGDLTLGDLGLGDLTLGDLGLGSSDDYETLYVADSAVSYVRTAAAAFMRDLLSASGENYVAVVTFDSSAYILSDFTNDLQSVTQKIMGIEQTHDEERSICGALTLANQLLDQINDPGATKNVILVTTGMTNAGEYDYNGNYDDTMIGSDWYNIGTEINLYAYANSAYAVAERIKSKATLYVLGLFQTMEEMPERGREIADFFQITARDLASSPYEFINVTSPSELEFAFGDIASEITDYHPTVRGKFKYRGNFTEELGDHTTDTVADYCYTEDYFFRDSSVLDWSMASMSLALELSSWASHEKSSWYSTSPGHDFYGDKLVNAKCLLMGDASSAGVWDHIDDMPEAELSNWGYRGLGFTGFEANKYWEDYPEFDSIGVCAANKKISRGNDSYTLVAVAIRGGGYGSEWAINFTLGSSGEH